MLIEANLKNWSPDKMADISRRYHWFPREMKSEEEAQKFYTDDVSLSRSGQYGISVVDPLTSFRGKPVVASGNIDCFLTPQNLGRERKKVILAMKIIVAGLKSREIHEENVINSLQPVITITQRKDIILYFYKHVFEKRKLILNELIFFSIFYMHFLHAFWPEWDLGTRLKLTPPSFTGLDLTDSCSQ